MKRLSIFAITGLLAVAGCGGSSNSSSSTSSSTSSGGAASSGGGGGGGGGGQQLSLQADKEQLKFNKSKLTAKAGKVTITMTNPSPLQHDVSIKGGVDAKGPVVGQGGKSTVAVTLKPGKYTFYCSVDGHEAAGMTGELDVS
jgi:plastocyanin